MRAAVVPILLVAMIGLATPARANAGIPPASRVCFWRASALACVERTATPAAPEALMAALLEGPTAAEQEAGLSSAVPPGTELAGVSVQDVEFTVRLFVPAAALRALDADQVERIVEQVAATLDPLGWRDLHVVALDAVTGSFRPLSAFLPALQAPRRETVLSGEEVPEGATSDAAPNGQPPLPGQGQPQGALSGKTVYVSAGHGWQWSGSAWRTQRPPYPNSPYVGPIIEDHNNAEAVNQYLLQYLWNAGALVYPVRERDMTAAAVVVNNDAPGTGNSYAESGQWTTSTSYAGYDLRQAGHTYRYAITVAGAPTAIVTWTAALPADGRYAVYVWYRAGGNRPSDAGYAVHHAGGKTTVRLDQTHHGITWRYIGTYAFRATEGARITLDNGSAVAGDAVIADAVRIGGGVLDNLSGYFSGSATSAPNKPWWEMSAYYYVQRQGLDANDYADFNDVIARPLYARWVHAGTGDDALFISWHSNGVSGYQTTSSGTSTYIHDSQPTEGSAALQDAVHAELVRDIRAGWSETWVDDGQRSKNLGELRELWDKDPQVRMPGVLIELAYHDHPQDTDALKDPRYNMLAARAVYQGIVKYYEQRDGVDLTLVPEPPTRLRVLNIGGGQVIVRWTPPTTDTLDLAGDPATGYRVYTSADGFGWSDGTPVAGTAYTLTGLSSGQLVFVRVTATNAGGESFPTEVLGARVGGLSGVLIVNGFDKLNRFGVIRDNDPVEGANMRMLLGRMNRFDYVVHHGSAIGYAFDSASNEAVAEGPVDLGQYYVLDWVLGVESTTDETLSAAEREALKDYLAGGGALFISGTELAWDLVDQGRDPSFFRDYLQTDYAGDDASTYQVTPTAGGIFAGLGSMRFDAPGEYEAKYPDQLVPLNGGIAALTYQGGAGGTAAVQFAQGCQRLVVFGFPFETIRSESRAAVMERVMAFLDECLAPVQPVAFLPIVRRP